MFNYNNITDIYKHVSPNLNIVRYIDICHMKICYCQDGSVGKAFAFNPEFKVTRTHMVQKKIN